MTPPVPRPRASKEPIDHGGHASPGRADARTRTARPGTRTSDVSVGGIFSSPWGSSSLGLVIHVVLGAGHARVSPGGKPTGPGARPPFLAVDVVAPAPRLQGNPGVDLIQFKEQELERLNHYGWVDQARRGSPASRSIGPWTSSPRRACPEPAGPPEPETGRLPVGDRRRPPRQTPTREPRRSQAMRTTTRVSSAIVIAVLGAMVRRGTEARAQSTIGDMASDVRFDQKLGDRLPLDLRFRDEAGREVRLGDYLGRRPGHPGPGLLQLPAALQPGAQRPDPQPRRPSRSTPGSGFDVVTVSISPGRDARAGRPEAGRRTWSATTGPGRSGAGISWWATGTRSTSSAGRRVPVPLQPADRALCPRGGHRGAHARRPGRALLLRDRLPPQGPRGRDQAGGGRADRLADRPPAAPLLRLRCRDRQVHALDRPSAPRPRHRDGALAGHVPPGHVPAGAASGRRGPAPPGRRPGPVDLLNPRCTTPCGTSLSSPSRPRPSRRGWTRWSSSSWASSLFFTAPDLRPDPDLRRPLPPRVEGRPLASRRSRATSARGDLDRRPAAHVAGDVRLGDGRLLRALRPARPTPSRSTSSASSGCGSCSIPRGEREINELHVPLGRPVKLTMTSQDVIHSFFVPAFRIKQDVLPGRYTVDLVPADEGRAGTTCSAPSTAARTTRR